MQGWEYQIVVKQIDWEDESGGPYAIDKGRLKQLGNEGWELVGMTPVNGPLEDGSSCTVEIQYVFKRLKPVEVGKSTAMTSEPASRAQSTRDRNPGSKTARSGFAQRAQSAAAKRTTSNGKR